MPKEGEPPSPPVHPPDSPLHPPGPPLGPVGSVDSSAEEYARNVRRYWGWDNGQDQGNDSILWNEVFG